LLSTLSNGNFFITADANGLKDCNIYIITVPTPIDKYNIPDLTPLYKDSELINFDEPTSALDDAKSQLFRNIIFSMKGKKTIIVVTHDKNLLEKCFDKTFEINSGNLVLQK
jgi:ABC-type siderophore export system fused ATPase/permease subunit